MVIRKMHCDVILSSSAFRVKRPHKDLLLNSRSLFMVAFLCLLLILPTAIFAEQSESRNSTNLPPVIEAGDFGALGNNSLDNRVPIRNAIAAVPDGGTLHIPAGEYNSTSGWVIDKLMTVDCEPGAILRLTGTGPFEAASHLVVKSPISGTYSFTGVIHAGDTSITFPSVATLSVGKEVMLRMGTDPYDYSQAYYRQFEVITAIQGNVVTFQTPIPEDVQGTVHQLLTYTKIIDGLTIKGCSFDYRDDFTGGGPDQTITVQHTKNVKLSNLTGIRISGGLVNIENEKMIIDHWHVIESHYRGYGSEGVIGGWGYHHAHYRDIVADRADHCGLYIESQVRGLVVEGLKINKGPAGTNCPGIAVFGGSKGIVVNDYEFITAPNAPNTPALDTAGQPDSQYTVNNAKISEGNSYFPLTYLTGALTYKGTAYAPAAKVVLTFQIEPDMTLADIGLPRGLYKSVKLLLNTRNGIRNLYLGTVSVGEILDATGSAVIGEVWRSIGDPTLTALGYQFPFNESVNKRSFFNTDSATLPNAYGQLEIEYFPVAAAAVPTVQ